MGTGGAAAPLVAGPLAAAIAGLGAGGAAGGIVGALIGAGIPDQQAKQYEEHLNNGGILLGVRPHADTVHWCERSFLKTNRWTRAASIRVTVDRRGAGCCSQQLGR